MSPDTIIGQRTDAIARIRMSRWLDSEGIAVGGRATPSGWIWEHASSSTAFGEQGVMRLVPEAQRTPGSDWWRVLHPDPGAAGGYSEWAIPNGAPKN